MSQKHYDQLLASHQGLMNGTLRDVILPSILGKEADDMLYWIGKDLAREYPVATHDDLVILTHQLGLGDLQLRRHDKTSQVWRLGGPIVVERIRRDEEQTSFGLELGFLAQEIEFQLGSVAEAKITDRHHEYIDITVKNDPQSDADSERSELVTFIHVTAPQDGITTPKKKHKHSLLKKKHAE
ncbi:YslB family protein [uncultured Limosilactobacillus sp.]|uniref:YslB family protein n=1 Tax=uncultured Limosilactobacillus sp. TaxID=2837629 RepID=UPI002594F317|nr:YslB family protein [uncultured Limosilactobacillus sp.]